MIYIGDDWMLIDKEVTVIDPEPVKGSTQMLVEIDGQRMTVAQGDTSAVRELLENVG